MGESGFPRQVVGAGIGPNQYVTHIDVVGKVPSPQMVVGHTGRTAHRRQSGLTGAADRRHQRMRMGIGGKGMIGAAAVADQIATVRTLLNLHDANREHRGRLGQRTAVFEPDFFECQDAARREADRRRQISERTGVSARSATDLSGQTAAAVDDPRSETGFVAQIRHKRQRGRVRVRVRCPPPCPRWK